MKINSTQYYNRTVIIIGYRRGVGIWISLGFVSSTIVDRYDVYTYELVIITFNVPAMFQYHPDICVSGHPDHHWHYDESGRPDNLLQYIILSTIIFYLVVYFNMEK